MIENDKNTEEIIGQLTGLYQKDPEEFEKMRTVLIEQTIQAFPERHRQGPTACNLSLKCA